MKNEAILVKCAYCRIINTLPNLTLDNKVICPQCMFDFLVRCKKQNCVHGNECEICREEQDYACGM